MQDITFFAKTNFRNQNVKFGIKTSDRQRHMYVIGKTGMGKTTLLENIVMQDIANGHGVAYIDPHGDTAEKLIKAIPAHRINDVVYFNPADTEFPIAFNILEAVSEDKKHLVASGMMGVFKKIWPDVWSARMEYILSNALLALLDYPGSTMMGVNRMMSDKKYRQRVYEKIKDPVVKGFWIDEFETWEDRFRKEAVAAIQNKVGQFLSSFLIRNIVGQTKSTINMREIMDNNKILIVNLSKGRIGEDAMRLLGGMIVTKIQLAAMERVDMPEEERKNFYLTVDEFQNFVTESFANILSEARKYRLNLLVAHQYISQLETDTSSVVKDAIFGNVGTIISFRVGAEDAEFLEKEFEPVFMLNDIVNLPKFSIYLKLMIDGIAGNAFSATALPPIDIEGTTENAEKVIRSSRERYAKNRSEVEEKIARWTGMITAGSSAAAMVRKEIHVKNPRAYELETHPEKKVTPVREFRIEKAAVPVENNIVNNSRVNNFKEPQKVERVEKEVKINEIRKTESLDKAEDLVIDQSVVQRALTKESNDIPVASIKKEEKEIIAPAKKENNSAPLEKEIKKDLYNSECDTCGVEIQIPFKPDGERPTFCKDCLKDYQRAIARIQNEELENKRRIAGVNKNFDKKSDNIKQEDGVRPNLKGKIETEQMVYQPKEKPLSLSQTTFMAPKKIKNMSAGRELSKLREIIEKNNRAKNIDERSE
ncbi:MAG: type IV secretory system conjugative DNA transfer family protein [Candidatus Moraniibacteriota bacterium]